MFVEQYLFIFSSLIVEEVIKAVFAPASDLLRCKAREPKISASILISSIKGSMLYYISFPKPLITIYCFHIIDMRVSASQIKKKVLYQSRGKCFQEKVFMKNIEIKHTQKNDVICKSCYATCSPGNPQFQSINLQV